MSSNKSARQQLEQIFGKKCMIEELGIRYIPAKERRKIKGYTKYDDVLTFHHIIEKANGGPTTPENGAIIRGYNHRWLHKLPPKEKEKVNQALIQFKASVIAITDKGIETQSPIEISLDFDPEDYITIPCFDTDPQEHPKFNRAKQKRETQQLIDEYYQDDR